MMYCTELASAKCTIAHYTINNKVAQSSGYFWYDAHTTTPKWMLFYVLKTFFKETENKIKQTVFRSHNIPT